MVLLIGPPTRLHLACHVISPRRNCSQRPGASGRRSLKSRADITISGQRSVRHILSGSGRGTFWSDSQTTGPLHCGDHLQPTFPLLRWQGVSGYGAVASALLARVGRCCGETDFASQPLYGRQVWDPTACVLRPAMQDSAIGWWPFADPYSSRAPTIHFRPADAGSQYEPSHHCWGGTTVTQELHPPAPVGTPLVSRATSSYDSRTLLLIGACVAYRHVRPGLLLWACLACYLSAWGAPPGWASDSKSGWRLTLDSTCALSAALHEYWWEHALCLASASAFSGRLSCCVGALPALGWRSTGRGPNRY